MNNTLNLSNVISFVAGAAIGAVVTWKIVSDKYEQILKEEINSVKEKFAKRQPVAYKQPEEETISEQEKEEYSNVLEECKYVNYASKKEGSEQMSFDGPYIIPPNDFGECEYETISLRYYERDGVLTDDMGLIVDDVDDIVGADFATHFGEYEADSVFVRNDDRQCDYEILLDAGKYSDLHQKEDK